MRTVNDNIHQRTTHANEKARSNLFQVPLNAGMGLFLKQNGSFSKMILKLWFTEMVSV